MKMEKCLRGLRTVLETGPGHVDGSTNAPGLKVNEALFSFSYELFHRKFKRHLPICQLIPVLRRDIAVKSTPGCQTFRIIYVFFPFLHE